MWSNVPDAVYAIAWEFKKDALVILVYSEGPLDADEFELVNILHTEVLADMPDDLEVELRTLVAPAEQFKLTRHVVFLKSESGDTEDGRAASKE